jgi:hypothetical protein
MKIFQQLEAYIKDYYEEKLIKKVQMVFQRH